MTTLNEQEQKDLAKKTLALYEFYNRFYRFKMSESEFLVRYLSNKLPKPWKEETE